MIEKLETASFNHERQREHGKSNYTFIQRGHQKLRNESGRISLSSLSYISGNKSIMDQRKSQNLNSNNKESGDGITPQFETLKEQRVFSRPQQHTYSCDINHKKNKEDEKRVKKNTKKKDITIDIAAIANCRKTASVDLLVKENIKKAKERQQMEHLHKIEQLEQQKLSKELQGQRNKAIREMNAKNWSRSRLTQESACSKYPRPESKNAHRKNITMEGIVTNHKAIPTESERRARIGLKFIELSGKLFRKKANQENIPKKSKPNKTVVQGDEKKKNAIKRYMARKKERIESENRRKKSLEREKKGRISQNMAKLQVIVQDIFKGKEKKRSTPEGSSHKKQRKKHHSEFFNGLYNNEDVMQSIKENLLHEITGNTNNEFSEKMAEIADRYHKIIDESEESQKIPEETMVFENQRIVQNFNAIKIQKCYRGYIVRKMLAQICKTPAKLEPKSCNSKAEAQVFSPSEEPNAYSSIDLKNITKLLQGLQLKSQNEKVVHLSRINTIEDEKGEKVEALPRQSTVAIQAEEVSEEPIKGNPTTATVETQTELEEGSQRSNRKILGNASIKGINSKKQHQLNIEEEGSPQQNVSLSEMRLLIGSEQLLKESAEKIVAEENSTPRSAKSGILLRENPLVYDLENSSQQESLFERNPFREFTQRKIKELVQTDNLSKLISMREKVMKYKEVTEKRYIQRMLKSKQFSPRTYQRKRRELEKWVNTEKEEIKKSKKSIDETWQRTAQMIEDAQKDSMNLKRIIATHTLSYNSETNSIISLILDSSRSVEGGADNDKFEKRISFENGKPSILKHEKSLDDLSDVLGADELISTPAVQERIDPGTDNKYKGAILIEDNNISPEGGKESISSPELAQFIIGTPESNSKEKLEDIPQTEELPNTASPLQNSDALANVLKVESANIEKRHSVDEEAGPASNEGQEIIWEIDLLSRTPPERHEKINVTPNTETNGVKGPVHSPAEIASPQLGSLLIDIHRDESNEVVSVKQAEKEDQLEDLVSEVYDEVIAEVLNPLFPKRQVDSVSVKKKAKVDTLREMGKDRNVNNRVLQSLAYKQRKGIPAEPEDIADYLDEIFELTLKQHKDHFIKEVNRAIPKSPIDLLKGVQTTGADIKASSQLPHEMQPIIPLEIYLEVEKRKEGTREEQKNTTKALAEFEQIHNKAVFDSVNEALNLIRPYGLNGEPMPWSLQQRILFKSITDPNIITRNIKNMILDWTSFEVGTLPKMEFLTGGRFDEEYFAEAREKHLANMLAQEVWPKYNKNRLSITKRLQQITKQRKLKQAQIQPICYWNTLYLKECKR
eukprot:TRINITY_DN135481_c1_g1_i1.p1 TRINITY_DN135481_c1_g1~~TRINITY_DN135481_c1_g1_i1.p1  ORF type:complete len:1305 (-),score=205.58 TRINITY_DN135481_c1_g1_i1:1848-5762(-)